MKQIRFSEITDLWVNESKTNEIMDDSDAFIKWLDSERELSFYEDKLLRAYFYAYQGIIKHSK